MNPKDFSILVVDDESMIVNQLELYLDDLGFKVNGFTNSEEALEKIRENVFDIVMTDLKMPVVSGMDIVKAINDKGDDTKIIIFTGFATADSAIDAIKHGVYSYIRKPYSLSEIRDTLTNAATQLHLQRENIALNNKIQNMFNYMSTLYDIISILYQVSDFDMAVEMVLDTMSEGIKARKAGIFLWSEADNRFCNFKSVGLSDEFQHQFKYNRGSTINDQIISDEATIHLSEIGDQITLDGNTIPNEQEISGIILVPIRFKEKLLGHIAVFDLVNEIFTIEDNIRLLEILATQIAPVFDSRKQLKTGDDTNTVAQMVEQIIAEKIAYADAIHSNISFAMISMVNVNTEQPLNSTDEVKNVFQEIIQNKFLDGGDIIWQNFNQVIVIRPSEDQVVLELDCNQIKNELEQHFTDNSGNIIISMDYGITVYPFEAKTASEIIENLNLKLFSQKE